MPRPYLGPQLWLDPQRGTWTILDGKRRVRTGYAQHERDRAVISIHEYSNGTFRSRERPTGPVPNYLSNPLKGVYVVGYGEYVKIGITKSLKSRLETLQTAAPTKIEVYALLEGGAKEEKELHARFAEYRLQGEWFLRKGALADWIEAIRAANN